MGFPPSLMASNVIWCGLGPKALLLLNERALSTSSIVISGMFSVLTFRMYGIT